MAPDDVDEVGDNVSAMHIDDQTIGCVDVEPLVDEMLLNAPDFHPIPVEVLERPGPAIDVSFSKVFSRLVAANSNVVLLPQLKEISGSCTKQSIRINLVASCW